jgi:hypothetical protein
MLIVLSSFESPPNLNAYGEMADLYQFLIDYEKRPLNWPYINIEDPRYQSLTGRSQGPQDFHLFPDLPFEIRGRIWRFSFPKARTIQALPLIDEDRPLTYRDNESSKVLDITFSYESKNPITAFLRTSKESQKLALSIYQRLVMGRRTIYFYPDRDILVFVGLPTVFLKLLFKETQTNIMRLLENTLDHESRQLTGQCVDSSTRVVWEAPFFEKYWQFCARTTRPTKHRLATR